MEGATLTRLVDLTKYPFYVIRRVDSGYRYVAKVISEQSFRHRHGFVGGEVLCLTINPSNSTELLDEYGLEL
ncbi:hypothetical protein GCM10025772_22610 [Ferrimonas gelatinilytica]|uniref:Uncharacterized protein n=1 Tax=Ferrimonas gelatinilytica TaxID=1255257 RepID=A0ABP9SAC7_9GAMM